MACTVKGLPATWAPCSMMATLCAPTSDQGTLTLYAEPAFAMTAGTWRAHPDGPARTQARSAWLKEVFLAPTELLCLHAH